MTALSVHFEQYHLLQFSWQKGICSLPFVFALWNTGASVTTADAVPHGHTIRHILEDTPHRHRIIARRGGGALTGVIRLAVASRGGSGCRTPGTVGPSESPWTNGWQVSLEARYESVIVVAGRENAAGLCKWGEWNGMGGVSTCKFKPPDSLQSILFFLPMLREIYFPNICPSNKSDP